MHIRVDITELEGNLSLLEEQRKQVQRLQEYLRRAQRSSVSGGSGYRKAMQYVQRLYYVSNGVCEAMREGTDTFSICAMNISRQISEAQDVLAALES